MKLLKVFGIVVGIHVFALILIFANPGCSSTAQPPPMAADTAAKNEPPPPTISVPGPSDAPAGGASAAFDPNAAAVSMPATIRFSPTRPGTPAAGALETQPVADVIPASTYTVARGDSLWTIAKKNHLTVSDLAGANNLKAGASVRLGQKLIIPGKASSGAPASAKPVELGAAKAPPAAAPHASTDAVKHTIKAGETLGAIARKYQVKMGDLATANNIADPAKIRPGMELVIPGWQAPAGKSTKAGARTPAAAPTPTPTAVPTISVSGDGAESPSPSDAPPVISVEDVPAK